MPREKTLGLTHLAVTLACTAIGVAVIHFMELGNSYYRYTVLLPGVIALIMVFADQSPGTRPGFFSQFGLRLRVVPWLIFSLLIFGAMGYVSGLIGYWFFDASKPAFMFHLSAEQVGLILLLSLGEEVGWRGYALPKLAGGKAWITASLLTGAAWAVWHYPGYLVGFGAPQDIHFLIFGLWVFSAAFIFTWFYIKSGGNVWTAVLMHAAANVSFNVLPIMPHPAGTHATFYILTALSVSIAIGLALSGQLTRTDLKPQQM